MPTPLPGSYCGTQQSVTECVSNFKYASTLDDLGNTIYYVTMDYKLTNAASQQVNEAIGLEVIDSQGQTIQDMSIAAEVPRSMLGSCFDSRTDIAVDPGHSYTTPQPLCYKLGNASDRVTSVVDPNGDPALTLTPTS